MKIDDVKALPPEWQPFVIEMLEMRSAIERITEKLEAVMHNQIALNQTVKSYEATVEAEIHKAQDDPEKVH